MSVQASTTLYFDGHFWCLLFESDDGTNHCAAQEVLGAEPGGAEFYEWILRNGNALIGRAAAGARNVSDVDRSTARRMNPKRAARAASRQLRRTRTSTLSQEILSRQQEAGKKERSERTRQERDEHREYVRRCKEEKARQRRRGH